MLDRVVNISHQHDRIAFTEPRFHARPPAPARRVGELARSPYALSELSQQLIDAIVARSDVQRRREAPAGADRAPLRGVAVGALPREDAGGISFAKAEQLIGYRPAHTWRDYLGEDGLLLDAPRERLAPG